MTWPNPFSHFRLYVESIYATLAAVNIYFGSVIKLYTLLVSARSVLFLGK